MFVVKVGKLEIITPPKTVDITPVDKKIQITRDGEREILEVIEGVPTRLRCIATDSKPKTNVTWQINGNLLLTNLRTSVVPTLLSINSLGYIA